MKIKRIAIASAGLVAAVAIVGFAAKADGRTIKTTSKLPAKPTYASHVAAIVNDHCVQCHRPNEVAPFSLVGYDNTKKWAAMMTKVCGSKQMPPWKAVPGYGEFLDTNVLSADEIEILRRWEANGAPRGDQKQEPTPPKFSSDWAMGEPDLVIQPSKPYKISPEGTDEYRNFVIPTNFKDTRWVTAMDVKPGNRRVVHHVIAFLDNNGQAAKLEAQNHDGQEGYVTFGGVGFMPSGSLGGWAPGLRPRLVPGGNAFRLAPGTTIILQVHYNKSGKPETDQTRIGLYFAKQPVKQEIHLAWLFNIMLQVPAGESSHKVLYTYKVPSNITLWGVMPHMHLLGKSMKAWAEKPDGSKINLIYVDQWDFNWQLSYAYKEPIKLPAGSKVFVESIYDNSATNPRNPSNPPKNVFVGEKTTDEMQLLVAAFTVDGTSVQK